MLYVDVIPTIRYAIWDLWHALVWTCCLPCNSSESSIR